GHLKDIVERYIVTHYEVPAKFVEQQTLDGTAGAINLARPFVNGPVLIIFVDTLFDADLSLIRTVAADGILWAKEVEDYQRFGVGSPQGRAPAVRSCPRCTSRTASRYTMPPWGPTSPSRPGATSPRAPSRTASSGAACEW